MLDRVHHIDFVVRDLDTAAKRYAKILGREPSSKESLEQRGVELVRFDVGGVWIILVQPVRQDSPVMAFLEKNGEGFFHIGYQVDDVATEAARLKQEGVRLLNDTPRQGVEGWKLVDIAVDETVGVTSQLIQET